jgi:hypothetical protein
MGRRRQGDMMLFLKSTSAPKAPGLYDLDIAAKPPGKTFAVYLATDPDQPPSALLSGLQNLGFVLANEQAYTHRAGGKVLDLQFEKAGTDLFKGWTTDESAANLAALTQLFASAGVTIAPRVMTMAEAYR